MFCIGIRWLCSKLARKGTTRTRLEHATTFGMFGILPSNVRPRRKSQRSAPQLPASICCFACGVDLCPKIITTFTWPPRTLRVQCLWAPRSDTLLSRSVIAILVRRASSTHQTERCFGPHRAVHAQRVHRSQPARPGRMRQGIMDRLATKLDRSKGPASQHASKAASYTSIHPQQRLPRPYSRETQAACSLPHDPRHLPRNSTELRFRVRCSARFAPSRKKVQ